MTKIEWTCWRDSAHTVNQTIFGWPKCFDCGAAPDYPVRFELLHERFALGLYIPHPEAGTQTIKPGSGIVGLPEDAEVGDPWIKLYYEGWVYGAMQYEGRDARGKWEAGVEHAAERMVCAYPTAGQIMVPQVDVQIVGLYFPKTKTFQVDNDNLLNRWLA